MSTVIKPELSEKNKYWIEKHRYYELKHFCLQYPIWKKTISSLISIASRPIDMIPQRTNKQNSPTEQCAMARLYYADRIKLVEDTAKETDSTLWSYILKGVTDGVSYDILKIRFNIPCCKDTYYDLYRRFFWLLDQSRK